MKRLRGFTLIELVTVVAIVSVLLAIAIPSYMKQVRKSRRGDAVAELGQMALAQERVRADATAYATALASLGSPSSSYYTFSASTSSLGNCTTTGTPACTSGTCFSLTATAISGSSQASDTGCTAMTLTSKCGIVTKSPSDCW